MPVRENYPMPLLVKLVTEDPAHSTEWYIKTLGFKVKFQLSDPETGAVILSHLRREKYQDIVIVGGKHRKEPKHGGAIIHLKFEGDIDEFARKAHNAGALIAEGPVNTHWNTREVTFRDPDGYEIIFSKGPLVQTTLDVVIKSIAELTRGHRKKGHHS